MITKEFLIEEYFNKKKSSTILSKELGVSNSTIIRYLNVYEIPRNKKYKDFTGQKIDYLTIIKIHENNNGVIWECLCDCGTIVYRSSNSLSNQSNKYAKSCDCQRYKIGSQNASWKGYERISLTYWNTIINNAKARKIEMKISIEDAWELFLQQDGKCALTKIDLNFSEDNEFKNSNLSLDRIDSSLPYEKRNIQWLLKPINIMKYNLEQEYFIYLCKLIASHDPFSLPKLKIKVAENINSHYNWNGYECVSGSLISKLKGHAERQKVAIDLKAEEIWELYLKQNGRCFFTGIPIYFNKINSKGYPATVSIDRIDNKSGYHSNNISLVYKPVNFMKNKFELNYFKENCKLVSSSNTCRDFNLLEPSKEWSLSFERTTTESQKEINENFDPERSLILSAAKTVFTEEQVKNIMFLVDQGKTLTEIRKIHPVSEGAINRLVNNKIKIFSNYKFDKTKIKQNRYDANSGEQHFNSKLTWEIVNEMRRLKEENFTVGEISKMVGVNHARVSEVVNFKTWKPKPNVP